MKELWEEDWMRGQSIPWRTPWQAAVKPEAPIRVERKRPKPQVRKPKSLSETASGHPKVPGAFSRLALLKLANGTRVILTNWPGGPLRCIVIHSIYGGVYAMTEKDHIRVNGFNFRRDVFLADNSNKEILG